MLSAQQILMNLMMFFLLPVPKMHPPALNGFHTFFSQCRIWNSTLKSSPESSPFVQPHDIHIRQYGNPEPILHKSCDNFNLFCSTHRLYLHPLLLQNLLLQSTETAGLGKHDLRVSVCLFRLICSLFSSGCPFETTTAIARIESDTRFHPISEDPNRSRYHIFHPKVLLRSPVSSGCR